MAVLTPKSVIRLTAFKAFETGLLSDGDPRVLSLQWGLSSLGFCSVSSDIFFVFRCTCLVLTHSFFVYNLFKKDTKIKNDEIF